MNLTELARCSTREFGRLHAAGSEPKIDDLVGWEFRGFNPPAFARVMGIQKFVKGFFAGTRGAEGYNVAVSPRDWKRMHWRGRDIRHGFYLVAPGSGKHAGTVFLDYGASPRNARPNPERLLRDFLVHPDPDNPDLLLGRAYAAIGGLVPLSFFILERERQATT
jgi:hypothetical protein